MNRTELKIGHLVSHTGAPDWGVGKIVEVTATMVTIQFSDGNSRKIAASHFSALQPASPGTYTPSADVAADAKPAKAPRVVKKKKPAVTTTP